MTISLSKKYHLSIRWFGFFCLCNHSGSFAYATEWEFVAMDSFVLWLDCLCGNSPLVNSKFLKCTESKGICWIGKKLWQIKHIYYKWLHMNIVCIWIGQFVCFECFVALTCKIYLDASTDVLTISRENEASYFWCLYHDRMHTMTFYLILLLIIMLSCCSIIFLS